MISPDLPGPAILVTMGEPAGIGPEIIVRAWAARRERARPPVIALADPVLLDATARRLGFGAVVTAIEPHEIDAATPDRLAILPVPLARPVEPGQPCLENAPAVIGAIDTAVRLLREGRARALVTAPIAKSVLSAAGFGFPGHTEYLAELAFTHWTLPAPPRPVMLMAGPELRTVPLTIHLPLAEVPGRLTRDLVTGTGRIVHATLIRDFAIAAPRLALAGLNPHAGEGGHLGREEIEVLAPAAEALRAEGIDITDPLPADALFHAGARAAFDVALCPTHDQALIPVKMLDFDRTVNVTLGLPFVRTSPDHGTAFDIAGSGRARADSLLAALDLAETIATRRHGAW